MIKEQYEYITPEIERIEWFIKNGTWSNDLTKIKAVYIELGYTFEGGCAGCTATMLKDMYHEILRYEKENKLRSYSDNNNTLLNL